MCVTVGVSWNEEWMRLDSWIKVGSVIWLTSVRFIDVPSPHEVNQLKDPGPGFNKCMQYLYISISSSG